MLYTYEELDAQVIYEDNHIIGVNKKAGQIVQADQTEDVHLSEYYKQYLKQKYNKPGNVFCGVIHRLDRPVSGVVMFGKTSKGLARMNELFRDRKIEKIYWAIVRGNVAKDEEQLVNYLVRNEKENKSYVKTEQNKSALKCILSYKVLVRGDNYTLLEVKPETGRHHQIRVQLSNIGHPIVGDVKYGDKRGNEDRSICLHARKLIFNHIVQKEETITITAPPPDQKYWNIFKDFYESIQ